MKTAYTSGQLVKLTRLMEERDMTPARLQSLFSSGILSDIMSRDANLSNREGLYRALGLDLTKLGIYEFTMDYGIPIPEKIDNLKQNFPWILDIPQHFFHIDIGAGIISYTAQFIKVKEGSSKKQVLQKIKSIDKKNPWGPANPDIMLAFASKFNNIFQEESSYVVGLAETPSVLMSVSQGLMGASFVFTLISQEWSGHDCGNNNRFLIVREIK